MFIAKVRLNAILNMSCFDFHRHGDWVQFNVATDRRDKLQRATNIELLDESFAFSGERRENGVVASLKEGCGLIKCAEREPLLPFLVDEWISPDQDLKVGDEVEFTILQVIYFSEKIY